MISKCPGQDSRNITSQQIKCPKCGYEVEIFSDEAKAVCPHCKNWVFTAKRPSCADWCKAAGECLGLNKMLA